MSKRRELHGTRANAELQHLVTEGTDQIVALTRRLAAAEKVVKAADAYINSINPEARSGEWAEKVDYYRLRARLESE